MLIDDDPDDQFIFLDAIAEITTDLKCSTSTNVADGISYLKKTDQLPSLIFLDLNMPGMNGFDFLNMVKSDSRLKEIPVIIYSTSNNPADEKKATEAGAKLFFTKTPDFNILKRTIQKILDMDFSSGPPASIMLSFPN